MPEIGPSPAQVEEYYMWDFITPSHYVDISSVLDLKVLLIMAHTAHGTRHDTHTTDGDGGLVRSSRGWSTRRSTPTALP
jgi:hypothetical protein